MSLAVVKRRGCTHLKFPWERLLDRRIALSPLPLCNWIASAIQNLCQFKCELKAKKKKIFPDIQLNENSSLGNFFTFYHWVYMSILFIIYSHLIDIFDATHQTLAFPHGSFYHRVRNKTRKYKSSITCYVYICFTQLQ